MAMGTRPSSSVVDASVTGRSIRQLRDKPFKRRHRIRNAVLLLERHRQESLDRGVEQLRIVKGQEVRAVWEDGELGVWQRFVDRDCMIEADQIVISR